MSNAFKSNLQALQTSLIHMQKNHILNLKDLTNKDHQKG